ncbi:hypothetical protein BTJ39_22360 [Izhakiella australiensis]|uniref:Uncharacterized protein n=1 Tax=Izhakiella australiensis TaxID=1926881 RepID=A0A1S8Y9U8_9GAMM|nr:hypothetical protein [Izhakiella australiensis]OON35622.1 hypothetical protein BTJ39_22360 [Izhakiella australiensis]
MQELDTLYHVIKSHICEVRKISHSELSFGNGQGNKALNRAAMIFVLEIVLHKHRSDYATIFEPLAGRKALDHLIHLKTKWKPEEIKSLSLADSMFVIQDDLKISKLPGYASEFIASLNLPSVSYTFDDFMDEEWDTRGNSAFLNQLSAKGL